VGRPVLALALFAFGARATADEPERGAAELDAARHAIESLEYPEAVNVLEGLLRRGGAAPGTVARAYELLATAAASSGEEAQAVWAYERLLALEPTWQPRVELSPRLAAALERARAELPRGAALSVRLARPVRAAAGRPLTVTLVADRDALGLVRGVRLRHRPAGGRTFSQVTARGAPPVEVDVPSSATTAVRAVELWAAALDEHGNEVAWIGGAEAPVRVPLGAAASTTGPVERHGTGAGAEGPGLLGRWWFWTGVAVVVAGAAVVGLVLAQPEPDCPAERACFDVRVDAGAF
jgi:hypothetical protein